MSTHSPRDAGAIRFNLSDSSSLETRAPEQEQLLTSLDGQCRVAASASWNCDPVIYRLKSLKLIAAFGVGVDRIDFETTRNLNIRVTNTPGVLDDGVADLAMALILATMRNLIKANNFSRDGLWKDGPFPFGTSMAGKTLGIAGLGRIGSAIALRAEPFKVNIAYHNRQLKHVPYTFCESLEDLAEISDILVCVLPGGAETDNLINANVLKNSDLQVFLSMSDEEIQLTMRHLLKP